MNMCNSDKDCKGKQICCARECGTRCMKGVDTAAKGILNYMYIHEIEIALIDIIHYYSTLYLN